MQIGGVTIFGLPADLGVYVDAAVLSESRVILGGGNRTSKVVIDPHELTKLPGVRIVEHLAVPRQPEV